MAKQKRQRILTNRDFPSPDSWEFIEKDETGQFYWRASEGGVEACFPVDEGFVKEKFAELGRKYDPQVGRDLNDK
jgi:hypothetical protein